MIPKLVIKACSFMHPELAHILNRNEYADIVLQSYSASCVMGISQPSSKAKKLDDVGDEYMYIHSGCIGNPNSSSINDIQLESCFELFVNMDIVHHYISKGYYIITNGWLRDVDAHIKNWGFTSEGAKRFFSESVKGFLLLDTKIDDDYSENLEKLSQYCGLPSEILPVGLSHAEKIIENAVLNWRSRQLSEKQSQALARLSRENANFLLMNEKLNKLVVSTEENEILEESFEMLNLFFSPARLSFHKIHGSLHEKVNYEKCFRQQLVSDENSFTIHLNDASETLGSLLIEGVQFKEHIKSYKRMGDIIGQVISLAISNARKFDVIRETSEEMRALSENLLRSNQSKDKLFSIISHDLRSPFNALLGFVGLLEKEAAIVQSSRIDMISEMLSMSVNSLDALLSNLLEWSRSQLGKIDFKPEKMDIDEVVDQVAGQLSSSMLAKNIKLVLRYQGRRLALGDKHMTQAIIRNLMSNAIKYSYKDSSIELDIGEDEEFYILSVKDYGMGMDSETAQGLFSGSFNNSIPGTNHEKGTGLGLAICNDFAHLNKGQIYVESEIDKGSTFFLKLPKFEID